MRYLLALMLLWLPLVPAQAEEMAREVVEITTASGVRHDFNVEVARTMDEIRQGLMYRTDMANDAGMLFLFSEVQGGAAFWMKNTLIPLDVLFIRPDGTIGTIHPNAVPQDETPLPSGGPIIGALELNGGRAAALGLEEGDKLFSPSLAVVLASLSPSLVEP